jgi:hypothetical protein
VVALPYPVVAYGFMFIDGFLDVMLDEGRHKVSPYRF